MKKNSIFIGIVLVLVIVIIVSLIYLFTNNNTKKVDLKGYTDVTTTENRDIFDNILKPLTNYYEEKSVNKFTNKEINSVVVYYAGYLKGDYKSNIDKFVKNLFNLDKFTFKEGTYKLTNGKTATVVLHDDLYTVDTDINYHDESMTWNKFDKVYQKEDNYIVVFNYVTSSDYEAYLNEDTLHGKTYIYLKQIGDNYKVNKIIYEKAK